MRKTNLFCHLLSILVLLSGCGQNYSNETNSSATLFELVDVPVVLSRKQEVFAWIEKENWNPSYDDLVVSNQEISFSMSSNPEIEVRIQLDELGTLSTIRYQNYQYSLTDNQQVYKVDLSYLDAKGDVASGTLTNENLKEPYEFYYGQAMQESTEKEAISDNPIIEGELVQEPLDHDLEVSLKESIEEKKKELTTFIQNHASLIQGLETVLENRRFELSQFSYRSADLEATFQVGGWIRREDGLYQTKTESGLKLFDLTLQKMLWNDSKSDQYNWFDWKNRSGLINGCKFNLLQKTWDKTCSQESLDQISKIQKEVAYQFDETIQTQQVDDLDRVVNECLQEVTMTLSQRIK